MIDEDFADDVFEIPLEMQVNYPEGKR